MALRKSPFQIPNATFGLLLEGGRPERGGAARPNPAWRFVFCKTRAITSMAIYSIGNNTAKKIPPVKVGLEKRHSENL